MLQQLGIEPEWKTEKKEHLPDASKQSLPCFLSVSRYELSVGEKKLAGSSQRLTRQGVLQHGSIPIRLDRELQTGVFGDSSGHRLMAESTSLEELLGEPRTFVEYVDAFSQGFESCFQIALRKDPLTQLDIDSALRLAADTFMNPSWNMSRPGTAIRTKPNPPAHLSRAGG